MGDCGICICDEGCWVCGLSPPMVEALEPGEHLRRNWNRRVWAREGQGLELCCRAMPAPVEPMLATFCWGHEVEDQYVGQTVVGETCEKVMFNLANSEARYVVDR